MHVGMNSSSDEDHDYSAVDDFIYKEFVEGSSDEDKLDDGDEENAMSMMSMQEELEKKEEHVLNFKGSIKGRITVKRDRLKGARDLYDDYFKRPNPVFHEGFFRRRFRMSSGMFERIQEEVTKYDDYFKLRYDCCRKLSFSPMQKCTAALRMLAYGKAADAVDEYVRMGESTCIEAMEHFAYAVVKVFGPRYLREPNAEDTARLLALGEARGFPGMLGSVDCMHWQWKNCPTGLRGQYQGHNKEATIVLEVVASQDLWI